jgi:glycosyltransferase involved in cell wall biosynthesis
VTPWLSVLMPVYNGARYLPAALESVAAQGQQPIELIAIDDGSSDGSLQILESFASRIRLTIISPGRSGNWVRATNRALAAATGEFVGLLHQDDCWLPGRIDLLRRLAAEHPRAAMLFHAATFIDADGRALGEWHSPLRSGEYAPGAVTTPLLVQNFIAIPAPIVRRDAAERIGGMNEALWYTADWDLWLSVLAAEPSYYHDEPFAAFRVHGESQTMLRSERAQEFREQMLAVYEAHARGRGASETIDRAARFSIEANTAMAQLAQGRVPPLAPLAWQWLRLGPTGWRRYWRDSRISERAGARLRLKRRERGRASRS